MFVLLMKKNKRRIAFIVSHPIQYYVPLYERLARRDDLSIKVFFTWHAGQAPVEDRGFGRPVAWDIPLTAGYEFELVRNVSRDPGTHRFFGLKNPSLVKDVMAWRPDLVHVTGWAWLSHLLALRAFRKKGIPTLFRGDSHLLETEQRGCRWWIKQLILTRVFSWPSAFLVVGGANRAYYEAFGIKSDRLHSCPHTIEVDRFAEPDDVLEKRAARWRCKLKIADDQSVVLFAGKFERKKRPLELMHAFLGLPDPKPVLIMVGSGELEAEVNTVASAHPSRFRVLPFQNQSQMPVVYRLCDLFVLPSAFGETWGVAVNEAMACGRAVLLSDHVGCALDLVDDSCGRIVSFVDSQQLTRALIEMLAVPSRLREMGRSARLRAPAFDIECGENAFISSVVRILAFGHARDP
jgi:glycosyltransferase involved in cell wall biosynthesis